MAHINNCFATILLCVQSSRSVFSFSLKQSPGQVSHIGSWWHQNCLCYRSYYTKSVSVLFWWYQKCLCAVLMRPEVFLCGFGDTSSDDTRTSCPVSITVEVSVSSSGDTTTSSFPLTLVRTSLCSLLMIPELALTRKRYCGRVPVLFWWHQKCVCPVLMTHEGCLSSSDTRSIRGRTHFWETAYSKRTTSK